jgi:hypothetical protein
MQENNITIQAFKFKHYKDLLEILESQNYQDIALVEMKTLPKIGYIAYLGKKPIAAGFLRRLEPCFAQIDTLCSNKFYGSIIRHEGIKVVVESLLDEAKRLKLKGILALTKDNGVFKRATEIGFKPVNEAVISLSLIDK